MQNYNVFLKNNGSEFEKEKGGGSEVWLINMSPLLEDNASLLLKRKLNL